MNNLDDKFEESFRKELDKYEVSQIALVRMFGVVIILLTLLLTF